MIFHVAPMMGYTDYYFRNLMHFLYEDKVKTYSEMIVDKAIIFNTEKTLTKHFVLLIKVSFKLLDLIRMKFHNV